MSSYTPRLDLCRLDDWTRRLAALANAWRCRPYAYGITDCWQFMLAAVETQTGAALMPGVLWSRRRIGVLKFMKAEGWADIEAAMDDLLPPMIVTDSRPGDVVSFGLADELHMAIRVGDTALTPGPNGLVEIARPEWWRRAWKVG